MRSIIFGIDLFTFGVHLQSASSLASLVDLPLYTFEYSKFRKVNLWHTCVWSEESGELLHPYLLQTSQMAGCQTTTNLKTQSAKQANSQLNSDSIITPIKITSYFHLLSPCSPIFLLKDLQRIHTHCRILDPYLILSKNNDVLFFSR